MTQRTVPVFCPDYWYEQEAREALRGQLFDVLRARLGAVTRVQPHGSLALAPTRVTTPAAPARVPTTTYKPRPTPATAPLAPAPPIVSAGARPFVVRLTPGARAQ